MILEPLLSVVVEDNQGRSKETGRCSPAPWIGPLPTVSVHKPSTRSIGTESAHVDMVKYDSTSCLSLSPLSSSLFHRPWTISGLVFHTHTLPRTPYTLQSTSR